MERTLTAHLQRPHHLASARMPGIDSWRGEARERRKRLGFSGSVHRAESLESLESLSREKLLNRIPRFASISALLQQQREGGREVEGREKSQIFYNSFNSRSMSPKSSSNYLLVI